MKLVETLIFEVWSRKPMYDDEAKTPTGSVKKWHDAIGIKPADITAAMVEAKKLQSYKKLLTLFTAKESPKLLKNGTFQFANDKNLYSVYGNGVIRQESNNRKGMSHYITRLKAPKPALVHGSPIKSLVKIYDNAFKELASKKLSEELAEADNAIVAKAKNTKAALQAKSKKEVFDAWVSETLPRINSATIGEQDKSNMIYDLVAKRHGVPTAKVLYKVIA